MREEIITHSAAETIALGQRVAKELRSGDVLALDGELGGGKTTFTKGLAKGLGISSDITSPTFVIRREYFLPSDASAKKLSHFDCYRLDDPQQLLDIGFEEILVQKKSIVVCEWANRVSQALPNNAWKIKFIGQDENTRKITIDRPKS